MQAVSNTPHKSAATTMAELMTSASKDGQQVESQVMLAFLQTNERVLQTNERGLAEYLSHVQTEEAHEHELNNILVQAVSNTPQKSAATTMAELMTSASKDRQQVESQAMLAFLQTNERVLQTNERGLAEYLSQVQTPSRSSSISFVSDLTKKNH
jgi:nicotinate-nucleotide pyrophosphorylase